MEPIVIGPGIAQSPVGKDNVTVGQPLSGVQDRVICARTLQKFEPLFRTDGRIKSARLSPQTVGSMEPVESRQQLTVWEIALVERRFDKFIQLPLVFHDMTIRIDVPFWHMRSSVRAFIRNRRRRPQLSHEHESRSFADFIFPLSSFILSPVGSRLTPIP